MQPGDLIRVLCCDLETFKKHKLGLVFEVDTLRKTIKVLFTTGEVEELYSRTAQLFKKKPQ